MIAPWTSTVTSTFSLPAFAVFAGKEHKERMDLPYSAVAHAS
jgi:hypothetical protein